MRGDQQMPFPDGIEFVLERGVAFPQRQYRDRRAGDDGEGDEQQMMQAQPGAKPAAETDGWVDGRRSLAEATGLRCRVQDFGRGHRLLSVVGSAKHALNYRRKANR